MADSKTAATAAEKRVLKGVKVPGMFIREGEKASAKDKPEPAPTK